MIHNSFEHLGILRRLLDDERNGSYLHIDARTSRNALCWICNVLPFRAYTCGTNSGDMEHIDKLVWDEAHPHMALKFGREYGYLHLLSGGDLLNKTNKVICSAWEACGNRRRRKVGLLDRKGIRFFCTAHLEHVFTRCHVMICIPCWTVERCTLPRCAAISVVSHHSDIKSDSVFLRLSYGWVQAQQVSSWAVSISQLALSKHLLCAGRRLSFSVTYRWWSLRVVNGRIAIYIASQEITSYRPRFKLSYGKYSWEPS